MCFARDLGSLDEVMVVVVGGVVVAFFIVASRAAFDGRSKRRRRRDRFSSVCHRVAVSVEWSLAALESRESSARTGWSGARGMMSTVLPAVSALS